MILQYTEIEKYRPSTIHRWVGDFQGFFYEKDNLGQIALLNNNSYKKGDIKKLPDVL